MMVGKVQFQLVEHPTRDSGGMGSNLSLSVIISHTPLYMQTLLVGYPLYLDFAHGICKRHMCQRYQQYNAAVYVQQQSYSP